MKIFKLLVIILVIVFLGLYFTYSNGYYERSLNNKVLLTNEKIEQFERDLQDMKDISINDYIKEEKNYATKTSDMSLKVSVKVEKILTGGIKYLFKKIGSLIE